MKGFCIGRVLCAVLAGTSLLLSGCKDRQEGAVRVTVIGEKPMLVDPARGAFDTPTALLLQNAAQGLVRFDAQGNIVAGLAERWTVSDDGLSYIFRLENGEWPSGRKISAYDVARMLRRELASGSRNPLKDAVGAVDEIVAMTDRVLEIRLSLPRPHLLQLLAQPEFSLVRNGEGTGPFRIREDLPAQDGAIRLRRTLGDPDASNRRREEVRLSSADSLNAIKRFLAGDTDMVLGGTFADLPMVTRAGPRRGTLRFDPVAGLFGFIPARNDGPLANPEVRALLDQAIDRGAMIGALAVPDLAPRGSVLQPGLDGNITPDTPAWFATPVADRRAELIATAQRLLPRDETGRPTVLRVELPDGPGAEFVLRRLNADWGPLGVQVERADKANAPDLRLVDLVAPSASPSWFLRQFRCDQVPICSEDADLLLEGARAAPNPLQRNAFFVQAERRIRELTLFMPVAAPVRWSLVRRGLPGFAENRFARHTLTGLRSKPGEDQ